MACFFGDGGRVVLIDNCSVWWEIMLTESSSVWVGCRRSIWVMLIELFVSVGLVVCLEGCVL